MNTQETRNRLKNLFYGARREFNEKYSAKKIDISKMDFTIDHLLYHGVIVPPCSIGEIVYSTNLTGIVEGRVFAIKEDEVYGMSIGVRYADGLIFYHSSKHFGKTVFLTKQETEKALRGEGE